MGIFKKKEQKIECSNEHIFSLDYDGVIKQWKCVVLEDEVVTYEGDKECKHLKIMNKERAPHVIQIDVHTTIYGEQIPFQLENGFPFIKLQGEWVASDTFQEAKLKAQVAVYRRDSQMQIALGIALIIFVAIYTLVRGGWDSLWMLVIFGIFFIASGVTQMVRVRNELNAIREAEEEADRERAEMEAYRAEKSAGLPEAKKEEE